MLTLKQFMLRQRVIKLYRDVLREIYKVPGDGNRGELLQWARSDFRQHRHHTDEYTIKMLILNGERSLKELQQSLQLSGAAPVRRKTPTTPQC